MSSRLEELTFHAEQLLFAYARAVDEGDIGTLEKLAAEDVVLTRAVGTRYGRDQFLAFYRALSDANPGGRKHAVTNIQAVPEADGLIRVRAYYVATLFGADGTLQLLGQYSDSVRAEGDGLVFVHKRIYRERLVQLGPPVQDWVAVPADAAAGG